MSGYRNTSRGQKMIAESVPILKQFHWPGKMGHSFARRSYETTWIRRSLSLGLSCLILFCTLFETTGDAFGKINYAPPVPVMVKDIWVGFDGDPQKLTNVNGTLFFAANDGAAHGNELWISDGTNAGTVMVQDIQTSGSSNPNYLTVVGSTLYFVANKTGSGIELWKSNGTSAGTMLVRDVLAGALSSSPTDLTNVNGTLFFAANTGALGNKELWKSGGTAANTTLVSEINPGTTSNPINFIAIGSILYFSANDGTNGQELWRSDGTAGGTYMLSNINPGANDSFPSNMAVVNGTLYFSANDGTNGRELWRSDGTAPGTYMLRDIYLGAGNSSNPVNLTPMGSDLYFVAQDNLNDNELWVSDGTPGGTVRVKDIEAGVFGSNPNYLTVFNGALYFAATESVNGTELWTSDGTDPGTMMVENINPGGDSDPKYLTVAGSTLLFSANDGSNGTELWMSDGTAAGTMIVDNINPGVSNSNPNNLTAIDSNLFFNATDGTNGKELWTLRVNAPPTKIKLSNKTVVQKRPIGTTVGKFSAVDPDPGETFTYSLVAGAGDTGNASFVINGNKLQTNEIFYYAIQNSYSIRVRVEDSNGGSYETVFTIRITTSAAGGGGGGEGSGVEDLGLPSSGFAPNRKTILPARPADGYYTNMDDLILEIPKINIKLPIVSVPIVEDAWDVTWLSTQVGYLEGTAFPTLAGNSALTAHVYQADGSPGPFVNLNSLAWGDVIYVHAWGERYRYEVRDSRLVIPSDASVLKHEELPWLTLITCKQYDEDLGDYKWRQVVRAVLMDVQEDK